MTPSQRDPNAKEAVSTGANPQVVAGNRRPVARSVRETAAAVRRGDESAVQHVEDAIRRHEASSLGAYSCFDAEGARAQAERVDALAASGGDPGPLAGVTVSVKDLYGVEGLPIRAGTKRELPARWRREGFLVKSLRKLGAVIVGKTHTVELAFGGTGFNPNTGTPANPWDAAEHRVPGGSSSGAGVSLWDGSARVALGSDTGGSIRIPASAVGVVGHRQTTGRWPTTGVVPLSGTLDTVGFLTHTAADSQYVFRAVDALVGQNVGQGERDGRGRGIKSADAPAVGSAQVAGLRIGVPASSSTWQDARADVRAVVRQALSELEEAGAVLVDLDLPEYDEAGRLYLSGGLVPPECIEFLERELPEWPGLLDPTVGARLDAARNARAVDYVRILRRRRRLSENLHARMDSARVGAMALPTLPLAPPPVADLVDLDAYREINRQMLSNTGPAGMLDLCAISLPAGLADEKMPVGLQLAGRRGADLALLAAAVAAESILGTNLERLGWPPRVT